MSEKPSFGGRRQGELFPRSKHGIPCLDPNHRLVVLTDRIDWDEVMAVAQKIRRKRLKSTRGRKPHLRALVGAVMFMGLRRVTYREAEDQIRHYMPARYLCGLTETDWTPDHTTIQDFTELMGEEGVRAINDYVVQRAVSEEIADPMLLVADTTAQEAAIPWPNEVGLLGSYLTTVAVACHTAGGGLKKWFSTVADLFAKGKKALREYHLFAKSRGERIQITKKVSRWVKTIQKKLGKALHTSKTGKSKPQKQRKVARDKLEAIHKTTSKLLPQIDYWLETGFVAKNKIVNLHLPEVRAIPRGKVGKDVEFGLKWGVSRIGGGFVVGRVAPERGNFSDKKDVVFALDRHIEIFGKAPAEFAYDRGGYGEANVRELKRRGVKHIGIAPAGQAPWLVSERKKKKLRRERARIEGDIGVLKRAKYAFNKPAAKSVEMMTACGQRSMLGYNLNRFVQKLAGREEIVLVG
jgi:hypothetical protein